MILDAHDALSYIVAWRERESQTGPLWIMGRSLGSASAVELAAEHPNAFAGLIIESGFAHTIALLQRLGIDVRRMGIKDTDVFSNFNKIAAYNGPTLILHAQYDQIIPLSHGKDLFAASPAASKKLYIVDNADHNTIMMVAGRRYFDTIRDFIKSNTIL